MKQCTDQDLNLEPSELGSVPSSEGDRSFPQENPPVADTRKSNENAPELREMPLPNGTGTALYNAKPIPSSNRLLQVANQRKRA